MGKRKQNRNKPSPKISAPPFSAADALLAPNSDDPSPSSEQIADNETTELQVISPNYQHEAVQPTLCEDKDCTTVCDHIYKTDSRLSLFGLLTAAQQTCAQCGFEGKGRWLCLADDCGVVVCSQASHVDEHCRSTGHSVQVSLTTWRLWCAICQLELKPIDGSDWPFDHQLFTAEGKQHLKTAVQRSLAAQRQPNNDEEMDYSAAPSPDSGVHSQSGASTLPRVHKRPTGAVPMFDSSVSSCGDVGLTATAATPGRTYRDREMPMAVADTLAETDDDLLSSRGLTGLQNLGNTCYMNSALQALSNCAAFADYYLTTETLPDSTVLSQGQARQSVSSNFQRLLAVMWECRGERHRECIAPRLLLNAFAQSNPTFRGYQQQDSQEFLRCFLDVLHQESKQPMYGWEKRARSNPHKYRCSDDDEECDENAEHNGRSSSSSVTSSNADVDSFETADSGCSSDSDKKAPSQLFSETRIRKRHRSSSPYTDAKSEETGRVASIRRGKRDAPQRVVSLSEKEPQTPVVTAQSWPNLAVSTSHETEAVGDAATNATPLSSRDRVRCYRSIVTDVFDGRLLSSVRCLTCGSISRTKENFQDLSLPIPNGEQLERLKQSTGGGGSSTSIQPNAAGSLSSVQSGSDTTLTSSDGSGTSTGNWFWWLVYGWMYSLSGYLQGPTIRLQDCLECFFAPDELRGDDMYNCEKCAKLRNGQKTCKVLVLPEVLCVHLKRFRHDTSHSTKVATTVTFPMDELDFSSFLHHQSTSKISSYELVAVVTHFGGVDGGHYIAYCRNRMDGVWYEYDDSSISKVEPAEVLSKEAYVLFYQKKADRIEQLRMEIQRLLKRIRPQTSSVLKYYISSEWIHRFNTFAEPGPITNYDFLCPHGLIKPSKAHRLSDYYAEVSTEVWHAFWKEFGGGPPCHKLQYCLECQHQYARVQIKRTGELAAFRRLQSEDPMCYPRDRRVISRGWFSQWERFVLGIDLDPPGAIDNTSLLATTTDGRVRLRYAVDFTPISKSMWDFFVASYGGGPEVYHTYWQPVDTASASP